MAYNRMISGCILVVFLICLLSIAGCGGKTASSASSNPAVVVGSVNQQAAQNTASQKTAPLTKEDEFRQLEVTPSGDSRCFLSPCDCNCYPLNNVPLNAKRPTCGIDCSQDYGVKGCKFTNYQCFAVK